MGRRRKKAPMEPRIVGKTTAGQPVVAGEWVFYMADTEGIHLTDLLTFLDDQGITVDWPGYLTAAKKQGWKDSTVLSRVRESLTDVYGGAHLTAWLSRWDNWRTT